MNVRLGPVSIGRSNPAKYKGSLAVAPLLFFALPLFAGPAVRIGFGDLPPFAYPDANGQPAGFQVDVLKEAARRANIDLVWVRVSAGPDSCLLPSTCDLYATTVKTPERASVYYFARPWWRMMKVYVVREDSPFLRLEQLAGKKIAVSNIGVMRRASAMDFAAGEYVIGRSSEEALETVCRKSADAFFAMGQEALNFSLQRPGACKDTSLRLIPGRAGLELTFAAQTRFWRQTEAIRDEIDQMAFDGQIERLAEKHGLLADLESHLLIAQAEKARRDSVMLAIVLVGSAALLVVLFSLWKLRAAYRDVRAALDQARRSDQAKSAFLATMSHEVRTPMNAIQGMTGLLLETSLTPAQRDQAQIVRRASEGLLNMLNDVLDLSKMEAGKLKIVEAPFNLGTLLEDAADLFAGSATEKGLQFFYDCPPRQPLGVHGDASRLRQVVHNLLSNAIKFTDSGFVAIRCRTERDGDRVRVTVDVSDSGIGIPESRISDLFKDFSQVDSSHSRRHAGTGLGLSISKRLMEAMGGRISLNSDPGRGSEFAVSLTLPWSEAAEIPVPAIALGGRVLLAMRSDRESAIAAGELALQQARVTRVTNWAELDTLPGTCTAALVEMGFWPSSNAGELLAATGRIGAAPARTILIGDCTLALREELESRGVRHFLARPLRARAIAQCLAPVPLPEPVARPAIAAGPSTLRVLLVEDNAINQRLATILLQRMGCQVDVAVNGIEALKKTAVSQYELILMDVQMPEMDGFAATRAIRAAERERRTPIVAMTANVFDQDRDACAEAGMDGFLAKPIDFAQLRQTVQELALPSLRPGPVTAGG